MTEAPHNASMEAVSIPRSGAPLPTSALDNIPLWDMNGDKVESWVRSIGVLKPAQKENESQLLANLVVALTTLVNGNNLSKHGDNHSPPTKRLKTDYPKSKIDMYNIWFDEIEDIPNTEGAVLSQLSMPSLVNALCGQVCGLVDSTNVPLEGRDSASQEILTADSISLGELSEYAMQLKQRITIRTELDVLTTTPFRIHQMICPEIDPEEFHSIRKRVYNTVVLGKGLRKTNADVDEIENLPVTPPLLHQPKVHGAESFKTCRVCSNAEQSLFVVDRKNGDVICTACGTVVLESLMHEGSMYRKFEGEADRSHHGVAVNPLYSDSYNMSTVLGGVYNSTPSGGNGGSSDSMLRKAHVYTEMHVPQFGRKVKGTSVWYKDKQKRRAFAQMTHVGDALNLNEAVVQRAKELFAPFRDDRELLQQYEGVIASCLCEAFDQLSQDGQLLLKSREQTKDASYSNNSRTSRRNELHSAKMAGKGGLLLDNPFSVADGGKGQQVGAVVAQNTSYKGAFEHQPISTWELNDCRSWLLDASRSIAKRWFEDTKHADKLQSSSAAIRILPETTLDDLEGKLIEHSLTLCEVLEAECKSIRTDTSDGSNSNKKRVVTPRLQDLGSLGMCWQDSRQHSSGRNARAGHGGSAAFGSKVGNQNAASRTAGQALILKTSRKLGTMLGDPAAGDAFHRELRALLGRQAGQRKKNMPGEATRKRHLQMKRKPWQLARTAQFHE